MHALAHSLFDNVVRRRPRPYLLLFEPSQRCDARCPFCYHWREAGETEMSWPDIRRVLTQAYALGCRFLLLGGGEPLLAPHLLPTLSLARALGYRVHLTTNGSGLAARLAEIAPLLERLTISLDYPDERHDELRRRPGLFREAVDGAMAAQRHGLPVRLTANVFRDNVTALAGLARLASALGCPLHARLLTRESTALTDTPVIDSDAGRREVAHTLRALRRAGHPIATPESYLRTIESGRPFRCRIARFLVNVDAAGRVYLPCPRHEGSKDRVLGRVDERHTLRDVWYGDEARRVREESLRCQPGPDCYSACVHDISRLIEPEPGFWWEAMMDPSSLGRFFGGPR